MGLCSQSDQYRFKNIVFNEVSEQYSNFNIFVGWLDLLVMWKHFEKITDSQNFFKLETEQNKNDLSGIASVILMEEPNFKGSSDQNQLDQSDESLKT